MGEVARLVGTNVSIEGIGIFLAWGRYWFVAVCEVSVDKYEVWSFRTFSADWLLYVPFLSGPVPDLVIHGPPVGRSCSVHESVCQ